MSANTMIKINKSRGVATVTLNRPEKHNAFDDAVIQQLTDAFMDIDEDNSVRVMVLAAEGKNFSAGADLGWMKRMASFSYQQNLEDARKLALMLKTLNGLSKPTIAQVQGAAFGGAVGLVSCCDIAVGSDDSSFSLSEVKIGLIPATISPYVVSAIGERAARRYFLSAERFSADVALATGLLSEVCSREALHSSVTKLTQTLMANSPNALTQAKQLVHDVSNSELNDELIEDTSVRIAKIRTSAQGQEGLNAFLEKREPSWAATDANTTGERRN